MTLNGATDIERAPNFQVFTLMIENMHLVWIEIDADFPDRG